MIVMPTVLGSWIVMADDGQSGRLFATEAEARAWADLQEE